MSNVQVKNHNEGKHGNCSQSKKKSDAIFFLVAVAAIVLALVFLPKLIGSSGVSFLLDGSGLNKLLTFVIASIAGWLCLLPSQSYKDFLILAKGARVEWRKTVKPDKDTVLKTTMMVLAIVMLFALLILLLDWLFGAILRGFVN